MSAPSLWRRGYDAKMAAIPNESCPVAAGLRGSPMSGDVLAAIGALRGSAHDLLNCPWCRGWVSAELRLYQVALDARREAQP